VDSILFLHNVHDSFYVCGLWIVKYMVYMVLFISILISNVYNSLRTEGNENMGCGNGNSFARGGMGAERTCAG